MQNNKWIHNDGKTRLCSQVKLLPVLSPGLLSFLDSWSVMHGQLGWCNDAMSTVKEAGSRNMMETHKTVIQSVGHVGVQVTWGLVREKIRAWEAQRKLYWEGTTFVARDHPEAWLKVHHSEGEKDQLLGEGNQRGDLLIYALSLSRGREEGTLSHRAPRTVAVWGLEPQGSILSMTNRCWVLFHRVCKADRS